MEEKSLISIAQTYLNRFPVFPKQLDHVVHESMEICVVIPSYNEPAIIPSLTSIKNCDLPENFFVEVVVVVNHPKGEDQSIVDQNKKTLNDVKEFNNSLYKESFYFHAINAFDLPPKHAGVGWARKIGMDEALRRFKKINKNGIICCFDADATISKNYLNEVFHAFKNNQYNGASIYFEHPLNGTEFDNEIYEAILSYELHLRYYKNALKYCGVPYAYHTVGSSMAVSVSAYAKQGGMNRRKAGEDFYFINKIIALGNYGEINTTNVIPSPRTSDRVPFGTGRAIQEKIMGNRDLDITYSFEIFRVLKKWFDLVINKQEHNHDQFPELVKLFLNKDKWDDTYKMIQSNSASSNTFKDRFFKTFDAFWVLKFVHFVKEHYLPDTSLLKNTNELLKELSLNPKDNLNELLSSLRVYDRQ